MTARPSHLQRYVAAINRANQIAAATRLDDLIGPMLELLLAATAAGAGTFYLYDRSQHQLILRAVRGSERSKGLTGERVDADTGLAGHVLRTGAPLFVADVTSHPLWDRSLGELAGLALHTLYCIPLLLRGDPIGVVQLFNLDSACVDDQDERAMLELLCARLVPDVEKARLLEESRRRERRLATLVATISQLTTTLDSKKLLSRIMQDACELLDVEATSIWLRDDKAGELVLHVATGHKSDEMQAVRVPMGRGIISSVVATGRPELVNDVSRDTRFYDRIDAKSGFVTRAILCVPLLAPRIELGGQRGAVEGRIIGGAQALNPFGKRSFGAEDMELFETFAGQAATVIRLAKLYSEVDTLSTRIIDAITGAIDLKDPYTRGHSQRVSEFSVAIAEELALGGDEIYKVRIASKLHDVGKIRVPDEILKKPARLSDEEFAEMKRHPTYGVEFLRESGLLELELLEDSWQALGQHHERLDGRGYPHGLVDRQIPLIARIVAVADVFDAVTSHRPYRAAHSVDYALNHLREKAGSEFDPGCVEALIRARKRGLILTQDERG